MGTPKRGEFAPEVRERAIRLVLEQAGQYPSQWAAISAIAPKLGMTKETLRRWIRQVERHAGRRPGQTSSDAQRLKELERVNKELRCANEILRKATAYFAQAELDRRSPRCARSSTRIVPSSGARPSARCSLSLPRPTTPIAQRSPIPRASARVQRDAALRPVIRAVWTEEQSVYGATKMWKELRRRDHVVARCTVERLMRDLGLRGVIRGATTRMTIPGPAGACPADLVQRDSSADAPNRLWQADNTYVATWHGFVYVAFVIDEFSPRIVGWRAHTAMRTNLVLDALEQALHDRELDERLIVRSDQGSQYVAMRYTARLANAGAVLSVGGVGDAYDNALAETVIGLFKTEVIHRRGPWRRFDDVEYATLAWVAWFNTRRLMGPLGCVHPAEYEEQYYRSQRVEGAEPPLN